jgi:hypothetical protein
MLGGWDVSGWPLLARMSVGRWLPPGAATKLRIRAASFRLLSQSFILYRAQAG